MASQPPTITTSRLVLRPYRDSDREDVIDLLCNEEIKKTYMIPDFASEEEALRLFTRLKELSERADRFEYAISREDRVIGFLNDVEIAGDTVELGYVIHPACQNQGYATEALRAAVDELFRRGFTCVRAGYFAENPASGRVMEKCGMVPAAGEEEIEYRGKVHRCLYREIRRKTPAERGEGV